MTRLMPEGEIEGAQWIPESVEMETEVTDEANIEEQTPFREAEIINIIASFAEKAEIPPENMQITRRIKDKQGNLVVFSVEPDNSKAGEDGIKGTSYEYMVKGNHGRHGFSVTSAIHELGYPGSPETTSSSSGVVLTEYIGGEWREPDYESE